MTKKARKKASKSQCPWDDTKIALAGILLVILLLMVFVAVAPIGEFQVGKAVKDKNTKLAESSTDKYFTFENLLRSQNNFDRVYGFFPSNLNKDVPNYVPQEIIMKFKKQSGIKSENDARQKIEMVNTLNKLNDLNIVQVKKIFPLKILNDPKALHIGLERIYKIKFSGNYDALSLAKQYARDSSIEYAEVNYVAHTFLIPNDTLFSQQWAHRNIQSENAWDIETGDADVVIAVIDTGVDWGHEDLTTNIWSNMDEIPGNSIDDDNNGYIDDIRGYDFVNLEGTEAEPYCQSGEDCTIEDNDPDDIHGHGTHVAGIIGAVSNNSIGVAGVCWSCKVMPVRAGWETIYGGGGLMYDDIAQALYYAADNGANVISMSFGGPPSTTIQNAIEYADMRGVLLIAAAGNSGNNVENYPAAYDNVIAVAATDINDIRTYFTSYGQWVDVAAPGQDILSTIPNDSYASYSGTSMATPYVSGLAGLIKSYNMTYGKNEIAAHILATADDIHDSQMGTGRINNYKALTAIPQPTLLLYNIRVVDVSGNNNSYPNANETIDLFISLKNIWLNATDVIAIINSTSPYVNVITPTALYGNVPQGVIVQNSIPFIVDILPNAPRIGAIIDFGITILSNEGNNTRTFSLSVPGGFIVDDDGPADFSNITDAIAAATPGSTIFVKSGVYTAHEIDIRNTDISLIGENAHTTIIQPANTTSMYLLAIRGDDPQSGEKNVLIENLTLQSFSGNATPWCIFDYFGVNDTIRNNIFENCHRGVEIQTAVGAVINNNIFRQMSTDPSYYAASGVRLGMWTEFDNVEDNYFEIHGDNSAGILVTESRNSFIKNNEIRNTPIGIAAVGFGGTYINTIVGNIIKGAEFGYISSEGDFVFHNNFVDNNDHAFDLFGLGEYSQNNEGNYWDNFNVLDANNDRIGDSPYLIQGDDIVTYDNYPLMRPFGKQAFVFESNKWHLISFNILPINESVENVFYNTLEYFDHIKTGEGINYQEYENAEFPLHEFDFEKSYHIYPNRNLTITIEGTKVIEPVIVNLYHINDTYFNYLSYPFDTEMEVNFAFTSIKNKLTILKDDEGHFFIPGVINTIGSLQPGKGYKVGVTENITFIYPSQTCSDGTGIGQCVQQRAPLYCSTNGQIIQKCQSCGCTTGTCQPNGTCKQPGKPRPTVNTP